MASYPNYVQFLALARENCYTDYLVDQFGREYMSHDPARDTPRVLEIMRTRVGGGDDPTWEEAEAAAAAAARGRQPSAHVFDDTLVDRLAAHAAELKRAGGGHVLRRLFVIARRQYVTGGASRMENPDALLSVPSPGDVVQLEYAKFNRTVAPRRLRSSLGAVRVYDAGGGEGDEEGRRTGWMLWDGR